MKNKPEEFVVTDFTWRKGSNYGDLSGLNGFQVDNFNNPQSNNKEIYFHVDDFAKRLNNI